MSDTHAQSVAFVRNTEIPPSLPPDTEGGVIKWVRENLFPNVLSGILTIVALYFIIRLSIFVVPWIWNGVWGADSLTNCREVLGGKTGACFSVITDRWHQLLFGAAYPRDLFFLSTMTGVPVADLVTPGGVRENTNFFQEFFFGYWRPVLAFVLLFVAIAPVLFSELPRKMLITTAIYPFAAFWLVWGGSLWVPVTILASLAIAYFAYSFVVNRSFFLGALSFLAVLILLLFDPIAMLINAAEFGRNSLAFLGWQRAENALPWVTVMEQNYPWLMNIFPLNAHVVEGLSTISSVSLASVPSRELGGFMLNMILGTVCVSLSLPLGILLALGRQSNLPLIKWVCVIFIEFIRGVPLITLLFVANVVLAYFLPPESNPDLIIRVMIMITLFASAYIAEVVRGGLAALPRGQYEAADSLGLEYAQAMRLIILPQALKISIPGIVNVAVGLFKDTTLVSIISMFDLVGLIRGPILASTDWNGVYWELFGFAALLFFVICYAISQYSQWLERKLQTGHR
ncbi:amino acid ABC transporter permease [Pseudaestuariivita rosea]|uniref:amino acid ABC transporter permease n=1 Tax=Pseudaestuariivita rosea TaxID=2763263 RepID=UPI001F29AD34|nr:amino acid ABC transporter permease [Pseudaestuariivita rosea]